MDCDAGSSRGEGFRRGDSAPGLPRGVGFGSRAGGSGSLRSPFVDVDSPSLPMVDALSDAARRTARRGASRLSGAGRRAAQRRRRGTTAARWRASGARSWAGARTARARRLVVAGQCFIALRAWSDSCRCPNAVTVRGL